MEEKEFKAKKLYWASAGSSCVIDLAMKGSDILDIAQSGDNGPACERVKSEKYIRHQLDKFSDEEIRNVIDECGADYSEEDLQDRNANETRLLWFAAWNAADDEEAHELGEIEKMRVRSDKRFVCCDWDHKDVCSKSFYDVEVLIFGKKKNRRMVIINDGEIMNFNGYMELRVL